MTQILLVNDDGIHAPGLRALWEAIEPFAEVTIVAPASEMSGRGMGITMEEPLHLREVNWPGATAYSVSGTPADCVRIGLMAVCKPDLVLSGINLGSNAGRNVLYSGTVGAAMEAAYHGVPAAALSCIRDKNPDFAAAASHVPQILRFLLEHPLPAGTILNINIPTEVRGFRMARQGRSYWRHRGVERDHPHGHRYFWPMGEQSGCDEHEESDVALLKRGYITAVPIRTHEMTHDELLDRPFKKFFEVSALSSRPTEPA